ncbi:MAG: FliA/WhiG family RNA polymerase sigma factor [Nitrospirota bacterium]
MRQTTGYCEEVSINNIEGLISEYAPAIKYLAYRLVFRLPPHLDINDLINAGVVGLMDAVKRFDPSRETRFKTYAEYRIRGAMLDEIRATDWVPRSVRDKIALLQKAYYTLEKKLGRPATEEETAKELDMKLSDFHDLLFKVKGIGIINIEDLGINKDNKYEILGSLICDNNGCDPLSIIISSDLKKILADAVKGLPDKERLVLSLYYYNELTMKEIGKILHITESRVCQLRTQAVLRLKGKLKGLKEER